MREWLTVSTEIQSAFLPYQWTDPLSPALHKHDTNASQELMCVHFTQGSHYLLILKFKDFSRTFKDPQISFSRTNSWRKFTAWAEEPQYLMFIYVTMVQ